jgi:hypothetical protein
MLVLNMKRFVLLFICCGLVVARAQIAEPTATNSAGVVSIGNEQSVPLEIIAELKAKSALLLALSEEHLRRAEQDQVLNQPEKSRWERELAAELQAKNASLAKQMADLRAQKGRAQEPARATAGDTTTAAGAARAGGLDPDEAAYLARLNQKLADTEQEIASAIETAQSYVMQFQTNNTPEQMQRVSGLLEDNRHLLRELTIAQSDLELRKLEFWANRRRRM